MTILEVAKGVALKCGFDVPTIVFAGTSRTLVELQECLNDTAQMIAFDTHEWTKLKTLCTFTGDGVALGFDFPADYKRMLKKAKVWPSATPYSFLTHYPDSDTWLGTQVQDFQPVVGAWTLLGDGMQIRVGGATGPLALADTVKFYYISNLIVRDAGLVSKATFTADDDTFRLNERTLKHAAIYRWKFSHGQDYSQALTDYETSLAMDIGGDKGSNIIVVGTRRGRLDAGIAFPSAIVP